MTPPRGTIYIWAPMPAGFATAAAYCEHVLEQAAVVISPGGAYGPSGEGFFRISLTTPDDRLHRGGASGSAGSDPRRTGPAATIERGAIRATEAQARRRAPTVTAPARAARASAR